MIKIERVGLDIVLGNLQAANERITTMGSWSDNARFVKQMADISDYLEKVIVDVKKTIAEGVEK